MQRLLATREDIFPDYTQECFEREFAPYFAIRRRVEVPESERVVYLMDRR